MNAKNLLKLMALLCLLATTASAQKPLWIGQNLGTPTYGGSVVTNADNSITITGGGADIWNNSDDCYYFYTWVNEPEWSAVIDITQIVDADTSTTWAKCELMVRQSDPTIGPQGQDAFIGNMATMTTGENNIILQMRTKANGSADEVNPPAIPPSYPQWLMITRTNSVFGMWESQDGGNTWSNYINVDTSAGPTGTDNGTKFTSAWPNLITVGVAVTAHNDGYALGNASTISALPQVSFSSAMTAPTSLGGSPAVQNVTAPAGCEASFSFVLTNNAYPAVNGVNYQWYKNGTTIAGATTTAYTFLVNPYDTTENGAKYSCTGTLVPPYQQYSLSSTGILTVIAPDWVTNGAKIEFWSTPAGQPSLAPYEAGNSPAASWINYYTNWDNPGGYGNDYANRESGWFIAPTTDSYSFYLADDDAGDLYVSADGNPADKVLCAQNAAWTSQDDWFYNQNNAANDPQQSSATWTNSSGASPFANGFSLKAGQACYIELYHAQGGGGDDFCVTYQTATQMADPNWANTFTNGAASLLYTTNVTLYFATVLPTNNPVFTQQPTNTSVAQSATAYFYAATAPDGEGTVQYQWYQNGTALSGATGIPLAVASVQPGQTGNKYFVVASTPLGGFVSTSLTATLNVVSGVFEPGFALAQEFLTPTTANSLPAVEAGSIGKPTLIGAVPAFATRTDNGSENNNDASILSGYVTPTATGYYTFYCNSDDASDLWLSTDSNPANKVLIAQETGWANPFEWTSTGDGGSAAPKCSDTFVPTGATTSLYPNGIHLVAGQKYYIEDDHVNGGGGDNTEVTMEPTGTVPAQGALSSVTLTGSLIGIYAPPVTNVSWSTQPVPLTASPFQNVTNTAVATSLDATLVIGGVGNPNNWGNNMIFYQWYDNAKPIAGATTSQLVMQPAPWNNGDQIFCAARPLGYGDSKGNALWATSSIVSLVVTTNNTAAPAIVNAELLQNNNNIFAVSPTWVSVKFNKPMNPASLVNATYTLSGGLTVAGPVDVYSNDYGASLSAAIPGFAYQNVLIPVSGTVPSSFTVTVAGATDGWGALLPATAANVSTLALTTLDIGTEGSDPAVPSLLWVDNTNAFTVECEGSDIWNAADGFNFVYTQVSGDFDMAVMVVKNGHSSNWAKAGLMVREDVTDAGSRDWNTINDPVISDGIDAPDGSGYGANVVECNCRWVEGAASVGWLTNSVDPTPNYPTAWVRLIRATPKGGNPLLIAASSPDGFTWQTNATVDVLANTNNTTQTPLANPLFVGICTTAHNNDGVPSNLATLDYSTLTYLNTAHYANFTTAYVPSLIGPPPANAKLAFTQGASGLIISWTPATNPGWVQTLQSSPALGANAVWTAVGTANPDRKSVV